MQQPSNMKVTLYTPDWSRSFEAEALFLPGTVAPLEVLPGHAPIISSLEAGTVRWRAADGGEDSLAVRGGVVRVVSDNVDICTEV